MFSLLSLFFENGKQFSKTGMIHKPKRYYLCFQKLFSSFQKGELEQALNSENNNKFPITKLCSLFLKTVLNNNFQKTGNK